MGHRGQPEHPEVQTVMEQAVARILAAGKAAGTLLGNETLARKFIGFGCSFVAVGVDTLLLARATQELARRFKGNADGGAHAAL
jgi:4-hydroxy-2-oxoheptanedioate aldolase